MSRVTTLMSFSTMLLLIGCVHKCSIFVRYMCNYNYKYSINDKSIETNRWKTLRLEEFYSCTEKNSTKKTRNTKHSKTKEIYVHRTTIYNYILRSSSLINIYFSETAILFFNQFIYKARFCVYMCHSRKW